MYSKEIVLNGTKNTRTLSNLINKSDFYVQMNLFNMEEHREKCATKLLINELNNKMKKPMLLKASDLKKEDN